MARRGRKKFDYTAVANSKTALNEAYKEYAYAYRVRATNQRRKGFEMRETMLSKEEFKSFYIAQGNDLRDQNKTASTRTINQALIDRQSYRWSRKQARAFQKILEEQGIDAPTQVAIMSGEMIDENSIWDEVRRLKAQFKKENYGKMSAKQYWEEEAHYIGTTLFGSP